jgi:hypothetical protein
LRGWSNEKVKVFTRGTGAGRAVGAVTPARAWFAVGRDRIDQHEDRLYGGDVAALDSTSRA